MDRQHVNIQHILASLALKATRQSVIIAKLSSYPRKNRTKKALWELDNLRRSLHLLNYVDSPQFQRNIQRPNPLVPYRPIRRHLRPPNSSTFVRRRLSPVCAKNSGKLPILD